MRRKSSRNTRNVSPEKAKTEPQKKSRRQSSRRRKRSSSRSSEDSEDQQPDAKGSAQVPAQNTAESTDVKSDSDSKDNDKSVEVFTSDKKQDEVSIDAQNPAEEAYVQEHSSLLSKEDNKDSQEWKEDVEDMEEKKNKGKSKGKNNSNFEQSTNNIEPETENENVQGTHQSPSNDYADNENVVQNVNDSTKFNSEVQEDNKSEDTMTQAEGQQKILEADFVSEYAQINNPSQDNEDVVKPDNDGESEHQPKSPNKKSTTPEPRMSKENTSVTSEYKEDDNLKKLSRDTSGSKKKITLRRSPPENKDTATVETSATNIERSSSIDESKKIEETKRSKKITLKRHTTDDGNTSEVQVDNKNDSISRSLSEEIVERKRRLSSFGDNKDQMGEDKPKKVLKQIKLIRNLSKDSMDDEEKTKRIALRRQRWGRSDWLNKLTSSFYKVDVDSIKIVCPSLEFLNEGEVNLESTPRERKRSESDHKRKISIDNKSEDPERPDYEKQTSEDSSGDPKVEPNPNIIAMNRKISIVEDTASKLRPPPSPAKNPTADVLFITNLVRPFTVKQLKELLERTGKIQEEGFWTDRIKSKCYVQYESAEEAEATRNALHGVHWPIGNGKKLIIDYATLEDLQKAKNPTPTPATPTEKLPEKENREPEKGDIKIKDRDREDRRKRDAPVREWDLGKEDSRRRFSRSRSRSRERTRKHSRRSYTPEGYINSKKQRKNDDSVPQKLMDDLFLKTKATPSIYWQPLSPEEIATKQQQRLVRMEEHKRRIEETRGRARDNRRPFRRR